ncbi:YigZ family protein [Phaeodactylibacter sp.]|uniref:IMPACT family protein n=2 Tax=Phaeodactylibacter sp. TaxID=1940289 RepID=UPI0025DF16C4|nr:YigZ family protein [Phaeodactylibacter sp.]MCI5092414.1 YigZ family protein [Phaeodactylibacter sp.]
MPNLKDTYLTISGMASGEFRDRGSKFIAYAYPAYTEEEWKAALEEVRKLHPKARHHCYAYRLGLDQNNFRANDDGEPSGTAGRPILGQIDSFGLTYVIVIVIRYFGGTLLGTSGLINAYRESTAAALQEANIIERTVEEIYRLSFDYGLMGNVMSSIEHLQLNMIGQNFDTSATVDLAIRRSEAAPTLLRLKAAIGNLYLEEVDEETEVEGLGIEWVETR